MRTTLVVSLLCLAGAATLPAQVPIMHKVLPESGKIGSVLKIQGDFLGTTKVDEVYLTDQTFDMKVKVLAQTDNSIEIRVPPFVKPGRLQLLVKTTGREPVLLEQPLYVTIEESQVKDESLAKDEPKDKAAPKNKAETKQTLAANSAAPTAPAPPANGTH